MVIERMGFSDTFEPVLEAHREQIDPMFIRGHGKFELWSPSIYRPDRRLLLAQTVEFENIITQVGDQFYGERAVGLGSLDNVTGMRLGTGSTATAKTGAGAAIVTYTSGSQKAIDGSYPQSALSGGKRRITYRTTWSAGQATANGLAEAVLTIEDPLTDVQGSAANTIARTLLSPTINKGASDTLTGTWHHDLGS